MLTLLPRTPLQSLDLSHRRQKPTLNQLDAFRAARTQLLADLNPAESEEHNKAFIGDFLRAVGFGGYHTNTRRKRDLVIRTGPKASDPVGAIVEVKRPGPANKAEMVTATDLNRKALHEALLYYLQDRADQSADNLRQLIVTNGHEWFIFDAHAFDRLFWKNAFLKRNFLDWAGGKKAAKDTEYFYQEIARPFLGALDASVAFTHVDLRLSATPTQEVALCKLFSAAHLLKEGAVADPNTLDRHFYEELLYLIGLEEVKDKGRRLIQRVAEGKRQPGALLENALTKMAAEDRLRHVPAAELAAHGATPAEQHYEIGLALCLGWVNRLLFLKLLEGQLRRYHPDHEATFRFLAPDRLRDYDDVQALFFEVLNAPAGRRGAEAAAFREVPYLNSSLFERSKLEHFVMDIANLRDRRPLPLLKGSVLTPRKGDAAPPDALEPDALRYLLRFLDAYDFASEATDDEVQTGAPKRLISAAVLGLIFEKINGYKDGSFYTPGFVTMYICRHTLRRAVVRHFNAAYPGAAATDVPELAAWVREQPRAQRPALAAHFNRLTVLDPAVGSGHFLVSALNELLAIKGELGLLLGPDGQRLPYRLSVAHDELLVTDEETDQLVRYRVSAYDPATHQRTVAQRATDLQSTLFREKRALMEHALFGVDLNPNSVRICRLRLWIELLKHAYYRPESGFAELETLPNLDLNIRAGNSLLSKYTLHEDLAYVLRRSRYTLGTYRDTISAYFAASGRDERQPLQDLLKIIRAEIGELLRETDPMVKRVSETEGLYLMAKQLNRDQFGQKFATLDDQRLERRRLEILLRQQQAELTRYEQAELFRDAFEWRYEFPEVVAPDGTFRGFDVVIGNPPYIRQEELTAFKDHFKRRFTTFSGTADLYVYFIELGMRLLADGGELSFIAPNKWLRAGYGQPLRRWLAAKQRLVAFVDFGDLPVFPEATTYPAILTMQRAEPAATFQAATLSALSAPDVFEAAVAAALVPTDATRLSEEGWNFGEADTQELVAKLRAAGTPLGEYVGGKIYRGLLTGLNPAFVIDAATRARLVDADPNSATVLKPFLAGRDVKRYQQPHADKYLILLPNGWTRLALGWQQDAKGRWKAPAREKFPTPWDAVLATYPAVAAYLLPFAEKAMARTDKGHFWWELRPCDYYDAFEAPKISFPDIAPVLSFTLDDKGAYLANTGYFLPIDDPFLLGVLNSSPIDLVFRSLSATIRGGYLRFFKQYLEQLPIPRATPEQQAPIVALVEQVLAANAADPAADTTALEGEIDARVAALYGLTAAEAAQL